MFPDRSTWSNLGEEAMRFARVIAAAAVAAFVGLSGAAHAAGDGDPAKGKKVFNKCKACHSATTEKNKIGPHLVGIVGRKVASVEGFKYSKALKKAGEEGMVWTEENLEKWLKAPKKFIPGNRMAFAGLRKEDQIKDVIAYLKNPS